MYLFSSSIANDKTENSTNNNQGSTASSVIATNNTATTTTAAASIPPLNAAVVKKNDKPTPTLPDKPVECTICSRKFKNIPALNGHMRLHGGYYKKDADGRRRRRFRAVEANDEKCQYCGSLFQQKYLNLHQQKCYVYQKFIDNKKCKICNHVSTNMISAKMHFDKWHKTERFGLMLCIFRQKNGPAAGKIFC